MCMKNLDPISSNKPFLILGNNPLLNKKGQSIMDSGIKTSKMAEEDNLTETNQSSKGTGKVIFQMDQEERYSAVDKCMKVNG